MLAATIGARWVCEQAHQQLQEELGLNHFEGRAPVGAFFWVVSGGAMVPKRATT